jgi:hypothetical protein
VFGALILDLANSLCVLNLNDNRIECVHCWSTCSEPWVVGVGCLGVFRFGYLLWGCYEMHFLGVGSTSNYNQGNSWAPRLRQAFFGYDNSFTGFHFLAGQAWSLLTRNQVGITPLKENIPLTIDASYVVGFNYTRNWQLRFVEQFNDVIAAGVSVEAPATIFGGTFQTPTSSGTIASATCGGGPVINGLLVNFNGGHTRCSGVQRRGDLCHRRRPSRLRGGSNGEHNCQHRVEKTNFDPATVFGSDRTRAPRWAHG